MRTRVNTKTINPYCNVSIQELDNTIDQALKIDERLSEIINACEFPI